MATGCTKVSSGCAHCYAEDVARRSWKERPFEDVRFHADRLTQPLRWTRPRRIFVNSLSDLFHPTITDGQIMQALDVMAQARHHTFQILTKRPKRMQEFFAKWLDLTGENLNEPKLVQGPEAVRGHTTRLDGSGRSRMRPSTATSPSSTTKGASFRATPRWPPPGPASGPASPVSRA